MKTKAKRLMTREFLLAATTVVVLALKALWGLTLNEKVIQGVVLQVAGYLVGQDALSNADPVGA